MKHSIFRFLLILTVIASNLILPHSAKGQTDYFREEHDSVQIFRAKHFYEMRRLEDGSLPDIWQEFVNIRQQTESRNTLPVADWKSLGPNTMDSLAGRMTCHAFNPLDSETLLSGSSSGGLWKTTDGGAHWFPLTDDLPSIRISAVAYNPQDTNHILIGTGFYQGNSFTIIPGIGILESFDGGETWLPNSLEFAFSQSVGMSRIVWDESDPTHIFAGSSNGVWVSNDMGQTWSNTLSGTISDLEIVQATPERLYAAVHSNGIYRSVNHGQDWTLLTNGLPSSSNIHRINIAVCDSAPDFALASIVNPNTFGLTGLYKTSNGGDSWQLVPNPPSYLCNTNCLGWYVNMVEISPLDTNIIMLGGPRLYRTINGGQTWDWRDYYSNGLGTDNIGLSFVDNWDAAFDPVNPGVVYIFNDGGVQKSIDNGFYWEKINEGLNTAQFYAIASSPQDTNLMLGGLQDHGLHYLDNSNGNINWKFWYIGDGCFVSFDPNNPIKAYGDNLFAFHYRTNNVTGGLFSNINFNSGIVGGNSIPFHFVTVHHPTESNILYTANDSRIFKSINGTSWHTVANIPNVRKLAISPANPSTVYAATYTGTLWTFHVSHDDGDSWSQTANSPGWRVTDVEGDPSIHGTVYATRNSILAGTPHVYKSTDHGENWSAISNGLPDVPTWTITINPFNSNVLYVGTDLGVFVSEDGGESWNEYNDNLPPYYVMDMHYHPLDSTLRIGTLGRGVWKTKSIPMIETAVSQLETEVAIIDIFPNPFSISTNIKVELETAKEIRLSILNELGQEVKVLFSGKKTAGRHQFDWDRRNSIGRATSSGIYFVSLKIGAYKMVRKVILQ